MLIVDDEAVARQIFQMVLGKICECVMATDIEEGLERLRTEGCDHFDAVLSDYLMPRGTGLDLLCQVRAADPTLAVVIASAEGERDLLMQSLRGGAHGYFQKGERAGALLETMTTALEKTAQQRRLRADATAARTLGECQLKFLGLHTAQEEGRVEVFFQPLARAGGDFVSILTRPDGRIVVLASDVSGHSLNTAYQSIYFQGVARGMSERGATFAEIFRFFNQLLLEGWNQSGDVELSIAAFGAEIQPTTGLVEMINCGFPYPVLGEPDGRVVRLQGDAASPLGWFAEIPEPVRREAPSSHLLFWSDGLEELAGQLSIDPLALAHRLLSDRVGVDALVAGAEDDIVVVRTNLAPDPTKADTAWSPLLHQTYRAEEASEIDRLQRFCERSLEVALPQMADDRLCSIVLCLREALLNALEHGLADRPEGRAGVRLSYHREQGQVCLEVVDDGPGHRFDLERHETAAGDLLLTAHRGLLFIKNLADTFALADDGRCVRMEFFTTENDAL